MGKFWGILAAVSLLANTLNAAEIAAALTDANFLKPADRQPLAEPAPASDEAQRIIKRFRIPSGFKVELVAAEPQLANPVAFAIDEKGRFYVSETHRYRTSALDIRHYMAWLEDDLASRSVADRETMVRKWVGEGASELAIESEVIRFLEDRNGDGRVDFSTIFAAGFNSTNDGIASGVLPRNGQVYFANIPNLWLLSGPDSQGKATSRRVLSTGYGVRFSLTGHDLHGLKFGPDGKLYFTVGDRGAVVRTLEGTILNYPDEGVCFRCNPDGSELEVFARGLRNPQELAFDDYGNLFTGDNDSDQGDVERWVYILEGSDSGWRVGYQHNPLGNAGPWNFEKLWVPYFRGQPAYVTPPLANIGNGPSGIVYYPGTGLPETYKGKFFVCYFKGASANSGIDTIAIEPSGAGYRVSQTNQFMSEILPTDVDFGYDGAIYFTDWNQGWEKSNKGRIYRVYNPATRSADTVTKVRTRFAEGFTNLTTDNLLELYRSPDQRVRLEAQYNLASTITNFAARAGEAIPKLINLLFDSSHQLARIHAIWTIGQIARHDPGRLSALLPLSSDKDPEIRAQFLKVVADHRYSPAMTNAIALLKDSSPRVQYFAALALGKLRARAALNPLLDFIRAANPDDVFLRHAASMALAGIAPPGSLAALSNQRSPQIRMAAVLALRKLESPEIAGFLADPAFDVAVETARAINDVPIPAAFPQLASVNNQRALAAPEFALRIANANYRLGTDEAALRAAALATNSLAAERARIEVLYGLSTWASPFQRDRIVGTYRPLPARPLMPATNAFTNINLATITSPQVQFAAIDAAAALGYTAALPAISQIASNSQLTYNVRHNALLAMEKLRSEDLESTARLLFESTNEVLRAEALRILINTRPTEAINTITTALERGSMLEKQIALRSLAALRSGDADRLLLSWLDRLGKNAAPPEIGLDILEAASASTSTTVSNQLATYLSSIPASDPSARFRHTLSGGNPSLGQEIFFRRSDVACLRCHKINGEGGDVGPALDGIASRQNREYLLDSLVVPNKHIAPGYESVIITTRDGTTYAGMVKNENPNELVIQTVPKATITSRDRALSAMPEGLADVLKPRELRDLLAYLNSLK